MGCCFSSSASSFAAPKSDHPKNNQNAPTPKIFPPKPPISESNKTPPPSIPSPVKEKVKEVLLLSDTPLIHPKQQQQQQNPQIQPSQESNPMRWQRGQFRVQKQESEVSGDLSGVSEMYSASVTISTTTTATTTATKDMNDDEATSKQSKRSPAKVPRKRPCYADPGGGGPNRRLETPSEKRARGPRRGLGQSGDGRTVQRNVGARSRSPATGRGAGAGAGRGSAVRRSPAKAAGKARGKSLSMERAPAPAECNSKGGEENGTVLEQLGNGNASLENPNVYLECFIFL